MNPLLNDTINIAVAFPEIQKHHINEAVSVKIAESEQLLQLICTIEAAKRTFDNTVAEFDRLQHATQQVGAVVYLLAYVHPDEAMRTACREAVDTLNQFGNRINQDEQLYNAFKDYSESIEAQQLTGYQRKYVDDQITFYRRNGFALPESERVQLKAILDNISGLCLKFSSNINEYDDALIATEEEMQGLPEDYKQAHRQDNDNGTYKIGIETPSYVPFMRYSHSEDARYRLMTKYLNRAPQNETVLHEILTERKRMVSLLGYPSYAAWQIEENMAHDTKTVLDFEGVLKERVKEKALSDYQTLLQVKRMEDPQAGSLKQWESSFYNNHLMISQYGLDQEEVKQYFVAGNVIQGLFDICSKLYGVSFEKVEQAPVWHSSVSMYRLLIKEQHAGFIYFDLYPRTGKYTHAACFTMLSGHRAGSGYQYPAAALVCNFPPATSEKPALLLHNDVVTLFHEFGHLMHAMLAHAELAGQSGISNVRDFVEVPSQMFENWAWDYTALSLFAHHYQTCEPLPRNLFDNMIRARNVGSGLHTQQQIFYGMLDMSYHYSYDPEGTQSLTDVLRNLQNDTTAFPYVEGTYMYRSFGHLTGYAAGYYGYLWAKVYAEDIFAEFERAGILNEETGRRFRDMILTKGSTEPEIDMVKKFLQRAPNQDAFLRSLSIDR